MIKRLTDLRCEFCGGPLYERCERVTEICMDCLPEHGEEMEERYQNYLHERDCEQHANQ